MQEYFAITVAFLTGMAVFSLLRRRDTNPILSGIAATFFSMTLVVGYVIFLFTTGRV